MNIPFKITYNTFLQLVGKVFTAASTAVVLVIITRNLPENVAALGNYNTALSYVLLFYVFTDFGLNAIFVRDTATDTQKQKVYFKNLLGLRLITSILVAFTAIALLVFTGHTGLVKLGIIIALGLIITQALSTTAMALFQTRIRYDLMMIADIFWAVANVAFVYLAATTFSSILFIIAAVVLASVIRAAVALYLARLQLGGLAIAFDTGIWKNLAFATLPIGIIAVFSQFNAQIDKQVVFLASYNPGLGLTGETAAGFYGLSYKIFELAIVVPTYIMNVVFPLMIRKKEEGTPSLLKFSKNLAAALLILGTAALAVGWILTPLVVNILGGSTFEPSILTTRILLLGFPLFFVTPITLWLAITLKKVKEMMFIYGFAALVNLVANLMFVPKFGYNAAAVVTLVTESTILILSLAVLYYHRIVFLSKR